MTFDIRTLALALRAKAKQQTPDPSVMSGEWMHFGNGRKVWPLSPRVDDIDWSTIPTVLANLCRFGGHTTRFYSVAEHSMLVRTIVVRQLSTKFKHWSTLQKQQIILRALIHDANEAFTGDIIRPLKDSFVIYHGVSWSWVGEWVDRKIEPIILASLGLSAPTDVEREIIHHADMVALATEKRDVLSPSLYEQQDEESWACIRNVEPMAEGDPLTPRNQAGLQDWAHRFRITLYHDMRDFLTLQESAS